ncbi:acyl carrier protein [Rhizobium sp. XQZ8]|uniref:acyl carrier protein n=1 Tax=Rhizobium populisoli TaxID=2859785 RepID=UPI001C935798|nr:acyl carrier protein [Rhizobium populisoli]MBW6425966.1 acyl carrier protein [Rhizobium populisoli]
MDEIADRTKNVIARYLDKGAAEVADDAVFTDDLGMDSLSVMELVMEFEEEFSVSFDDHAVDSIVTVRDAIGAIRTAIAEGATAA